MTQEVNKPHDFIVDFVTGRSIPDVGAEANRQMVEKFLIQHKSYTAADIEINVPIEVQVAGEPYRSQVDLTVSIDGRRIMVIKCAAGSLGSREREVVSAARLLESYQIPWAVVSDGRTAIVMDTVSGKTIDEGLDAIPSREDARQLLAQKTLEPLAPGKRVREQVIFRSFDMENVNRVIE